MSLADHRERRAEPPVRTVSPLAAFLSYLVPGLGQIYQGRIAKGLLFLVCLYSLFFLGMYLGDWRNVYLLDEKDPRLSPLAALGHRPQFAGQFWIGAAAWPAVWHYWHAEDQAARAPFFGDFQKAPDETLLNELQRSGSKVWDLGWVYTVIAGVLNVLVIYDALAGPAFLVSDEPERLPGEAAA
jgi:hypothetical protein